MKTITDKYAKMNKELHKRRPDYGCKSSRHLSTVKALAAACDCDTILDYGCGKGDLLKALVKEGYKAEGYDPGHPDFTQRPNKADLVVCTDVMEHIEPEMLDNVIEDILSLANKAVFFLIALRPDSSKCLKDGSNPHKIVETFDWWKAQMRSFKVREISHVPGDQVQFVLLKHFSEN